MIDGTLIIQILVGITALLIPILVGAVINLLIKKAGKEKLQKLQQDIYAKRNLTEIAVRFVEQAYKDLHGEEKYNKAAEWLAREAKRRGIEMTEQEIKGFIESTLKEIKEEWETQWNEKIETK